MIDDNAGATDKYTKYSGFLCKKADGSALNIPTGAEETTKATWNACAVLCDSVSTCSAFNYNTNTKQCIGYIDAADRTYVGSSNWYCYHSKPSVSGYASTYTKSSN